MSLTYRQLMDELARLLKSRSSGTLFIHSDCNHAISFTLESGQLKAVYFGPRKGLKAIPLIRDISGGTCHFDDSEMSRRHQDLPPTHEIMAQLHQSRSTAKTPSDSQPEHSAESWPEEMRSKILGELQQILTENLGPIADIIFEESLDELGEPCSTLDSFERLIDKLSLNIEPGEIGQFHDQVSEILSRNT